MLTNLATFSKILFYLPLDLNYPSVSIYGTSSISHQTLDYYLAWLLRRDNRNILLMHFRQKIARGPVSFSLAPLKMREAFLWLGTTIHLQYKAFRQWSHDVVKVFLFYFNPLVLGCLVEVHSVGCIGVRKEGIHVKWAPNHGEENGPSICLVDFILQRKSVLLYRGLKPYYYYLAW